MTKIKYISLLFILCQLWAANAVAADINNVIVTRDSGLTISLKVDGAFTPAMDEAIQSGLPVTFTFIVELFEERTIFPNKKIGTWKFGHTVKYDLLKEEYEIRRAEKPGVERTKNVAEMKSLMSECSDVVVSPLPMLNASKNYNVRFKAMLDEIKLPFYLDYLFFFVKLWEFETPWYTFRFVSKSSQ